MNPSKKLGLYWLSREQKLLLKASVLEGKDALGAWETWKESVDIENLDSGSNILLCQLYRNLSAHRVEDFHMARLKGIFKRNWYANQLLVKKLQTILQSLESSDIPVMLLGDVAFLAGYEEDYPCHPLYQINLLVHTASGEKVLELLAQLGWKQINKSKSILTEQNLLIQLQDKFGTRLQLQGHLFWALPQDYTEKQLWANAISTQIGDTKTLILNPTDLFLHLCMKSFYRNTNVEINLLADAMIILKAGEKDFNWIELVSQAQRYRVILPLRNMLTLLQELFEVSIPQWVLPALHQAPVSHHELMKYRILVSRKKTFLKSILLRIVYFLKAKSRIFDYKLKLS